MANKTKMKQRILIYVILFLSLIPFVQSANFSCTTGDLFQETSLDVQDYENVATASTYFCEGIVDFHKQENYYLSLMQSRVDQGLGACRSSRANLLYVNDLSGDHVANVTWQPFNKAITKTAMDADSDIWITAISEDKFDSDKFYVLEGFQNDSTKCKGGGGINFYCFNVYRCNLSDTINQVHIFGGNGTNTHELNSSCEFIDWNTLDYGNNAPDTFFPQGDMDLISYNSTGVVFVTNWDSLKAHYDIFTGLQAIRTQGMHGGADAFGGTYYDWNGVGTFGANRNSTSFNTTLRQGSLGYNQSWAMTEIPETTFSGLGYYAGLSVDNNFYYTYLNDNKTARQYCFGYSPSNNLTDNQTNPTGITYDYANDRYWIINKSASGGTSRIFIYGSDWSYVSEIELASGNQDPDGLEWTYKNFYVVDSFDKLIYNYTLAGVLTNTISISANATLPYGITVNHETGIISVVDNTDSKLEKYTSDGSISSQFDPELTNVYGIAYDNFVGTTYMFDRNDRKIYEYFGDTKTGNTVDLYTANTNPLGMVFNNVTENIYIVDGAGFIYTYFFTEYINETLTCDYGSDSIAFCDDFSYSNSILNHGWSYNGATFTPTNNRFQDLLPIGTTLYNLNVDDIIGIDSTVSDATISLDYTQVQGDGTSILMSDDDNIMVWLQFGTTYFYAWDGSDWLNLGTHDRTNGQNIEVHINDFETCNFDILVDDVLKGDDLVCWANGVGLTQLEFDISDFSADQEFYLDNVYIYRGENIINDTTAYISPEEAGDLWAGFYKRDVPNLDNASGYSVQTFDTRECARLGYSANALCPLKLIVHQILEDVKDWVFGNLLLILILIAMIGVGILLGTGKGGDVINYIQEKRRGD